MHRERILIIRQRYSKTLRGKRRFNIGRNSKKVTIANIQMAYVGSIKSAE